MYIQSTESILALLTCAHNQGSSLGTGQLMQELNPEGD